MRPFMDADFLLESVTARTLYHEEAERLPIIDYHCHLDPRMIAEDHRFEDLTELWLGGDHYKWRAMRANGIPETHVTGNAPSREKFRAWASTVPMTMRNPLYHWTHLELRRAFGIQDILCQDTADSIFDQCNAMLREDGFTARGLMRRFNVQVVCTTDDPADDLRWHEMIARDRFEIRVLPAWRPDKVMAVDAGKPFTDYLARLSEASKVDISSLNDLLEALERRHRFFQEHGCLVSDHGLESFLYEDCTASEADRILAKALSGGVPDPGEALRFRSFMLCHLARMDHKSGWVQQYHFGALRNNNSRMFRLLGPDTGYDSMGDETAAKGMSRFFDRLSSEDALARTIVYNLNPALNDMVATMIGNFQDGRTPGKMQWGSGWWFLDQKDGIEKQLNTLSLHGLLSRFVGMLTDSRSFLSYPRHEYFRRILCNLIGRDVENGELPASQMPLIRELVRGISYGNARDYFGFRSISEHE